MFHLRTFGGLSLESDSGPLSPSAAQRRRLALLVLLARAGDQGVTREKIVGYLWPDSSEQRARHALEQLLYLTRRDLGRASVLTRSGSLRLAPEIVNADVAEFEDALGHGDLERAVATYSGPFLEGVYLDDAAEFERWVESERAELQERCAAALEKLAAAAAARGDRAGAVDFWRRLVGMDPLSSRYAAGLIRTLFEAGETATALRHAQLHEALVRQELELEPDPSITALVHAIRQTPAVPGAVELRRTLDPPRIRPPEGSSAGTGFSRPRFGWGCWAVFIVFAAATLVGILELGARSALKGNPSTGGDAPQDGELPSATLGARVPDPEAHALYVRGRIEWNRRSREGLEQAIVLFRQATERDPAYAEAHSGLAVAYVMIGYHGFIPGDAAFPKGKAAALQALSLDPANGEAYAALGKALQWERRWMEAEDALQRAVKHAPHNATAHQWYALLLTILGRMDEAIVHARQAAELNALSTQVQNTYGITFYHARMLDSALHVYARVVAHEPDTAWVRQNPWVLANYGKVAAAAGRGQDAIRLLERAAKEVPGHPRPLYNLAVTHFRAGDPARAQAAFELADPLHPHYRLYRGLLHAWLGDLDAAFDWLGRIDEWGPANVLTLTGDPWPETLQTDPRYLALKQGLGLPSPD